ncbi:MAG: hypothetical protein HYX34_13940 [Actinobacteria bacterium]|nr:hypothetical protein [Actinomycetota bacterium]
MAVRRRQDWGDVAPVPARAVEVVTDAQARRVVERARRAGDAMPPLVLLGGDLCRTLGGTGDRARLDQGRGTRVVVDVGAVRADGSRHWFVAHLVARRSWWTGRVWAACNAEYIGAWDAAPRAHPGDGLLDTLDVSLTFNDRLKARSRLAAGTHVPHPGIVERRSVAVEVDFERPTPIWLDGERTATARHLSVSVEPDALHCWV